MVPTRLGRRAGTEIVSEIGTGGGGTAVGPVPGALDPQSVGGWTSRPLAVGLGPTGGLALFAGVTARAGPPAGPPRCLRYHRSNLTSGVSNVYPPRVRPRARVRGPSALPRGPRRGDQ